MAQNYSRTRSRRAQSLRASKEQHQQSHAVQRVALTVTRSNDVNYRSLDMTN